MASKEKEPTLRSTNRSGSDEVYDLLCDPCRTENLHKEAVGFCQDCNEYLCNSCCKYHAKLSVTRHHTLLGKSTMPKCKSHYSKNVFQTNDRTIITDNLKETCSKHNDKLVEYICTVHDELCCIVCMTLDHATCPGRSYIPDVASGILKSWEYNNLHADLDMLVSMATRHQMKVDGSRIANEQFQCKSFARIKSLRANINEMLDKLQMKAEQEVTHVYNKNMIKIRRASMECEIAIYELQAMISNLKTKEREGLINQLYVDTKLSSKKMPILEQQSQTMSDWTIEQYQIADNINLQELESTLSALLSLSVQPDGPITKAQYQQKINVKADRDAYDCFISGIAVLTGDRVVVTDELNEAVKLIDVKKNKILSHLSVSSRPRNVTETEPNKIAVLLDDSTIELFDVTHALSKIKAIQMPNTDMYGICSYQGNMIIVCREPCCLKRIDMTGKVLKACWNRETVFTSPSRVALSPNQTVLYVTDKDAHTVTTITVDGKVKSVYKSDMLELPLGITVCSNGEVLVCSHATHTIHQLSPSGHFIQILLDENLNLANYPRAIAHCG